MIDQARVLFFATLREKAGVRETSIEFPHGAHIAEIKKYVLERFPALEKSMETVIVALNHQFAFDEDVVSNGDEIAMFPPVSGGEASKKKNPTVIQIVENEININQIVAEITSPTTGATCLFTGTVRGITTRKVQRQTDHLVYDAYIDMAQSKMSQICDEIRSQWEEVQGIALVQRIGKLLPGTVSVVVACSSSHRDSGIFEAARYGIDRLKEIVPVWKKEVTEDGEAWVEGEYYPHHGD